MSEDWVVVAKPSAVAVHRSAMCRDAKPMLQRVRIQLGERLWCVHRLDRPTSGCLIFARSAAACTRIQAAMASPTARKRYVALVRGQIKDLGTWVDVDNPMKDSEGVLKDASTRLRGIASCAEPRCSIVEALPRTGRYHQVRRHIRDLSHPVIGDSMHGDTRVNRWWRENWRLRRLALHCLSIDLPDIGLSATCPLPGRLTRKLRRLPLWDDAVAVLPELALRPPQPPEA